MALVRLTCVLVLTAPGSSALAQALYPFGRGDLNALYQRVLRDPTNVKLTLEYAQLAKNYGDYEGAIAAYEKLLLFNPTLSDVQFELGVLYFLLESYPASKSYFEAVLAARGVSPEVRKNATAYLKEIDRRLSPQRFIGYLHGGLRHQTNANAGSSAGLVRFGGQDVVLDTAFLKRADWNAFVQTDMLYEQDIGTRGDTFEVNFGGYYARQFKIRQVNLGAAELQAGPRLLFFPEYFSNTTAKFYGIVNGVSLGDDPYFRTFGGGAALRKKLDPVTIVEASVEFRDRKFYNSVNYPTAGQQTGDLVTATALASGLVYGPVRWQARVSYDWNQSNFAFWSYRRPSAEFALPITVNLNLFGSWSGLLTPYVGGSLSDFKIPDPFYDPNVTRRDRAWYVGTTLEGNLVGDVNFRMNVNYLSNESNLVNFAYRNFSISFGPSFRF